MPETGPPSAPPIGRESRVRLADLTEDLLWPRLFRAFALAARPKRIFLALMILALTYLIGMAGRADELPPRALKAWQEQQIEQGLSIESPPGRANFAGFVMRHVTGSLRDMAEGVLELNAGKTRAALEYMIDEVPRKTWIRYGPLSLMLGVPILIVWTIGGCALCRMTACDFSQGVLIRLRDALRFSLERVGSLLVAGLGPLALVGFIGLLLALAGWVLLGITLVQPFGAAVFGGLVAVSAVAVVVLVAYGLGWPMLIPAVACEATDGIDAVQRAFAYVLGQPLRLLLLCLLLLVVGFPLIVILDQVGLATGAFARWSSLLLVTGEAWDNLRVHEGETAPPTIAGQVMYAWSLALPRAIVASYAVSLFFSASTILYLVLRQAHDGQDCGEIWMPGMVEGAMAEALKARARIASGLGLDEGRIQVQRDAEEESG